MQLFVAEGAGYTRYSPVCNKSMARKLQKFLSRATRAPVLVRPHRSSIVPPQKMADFHAILDVPALWTCLGALLPGEIGQLKWRARCLLVSPRALQGRRLVLYRLRGQQEVDECFWWDSHSSCQSLCRSSSWASLPSYYDASEIGD
jgi:hypothetical protein